MKKIIIPAMFAAVMVSSIGCKNYLNAVPEKDIETFESVFETRDGANRWLMTAYAYMSSGILNNIGSDVGVTGADEFTGGDWIRNWGFQGFYVADGLQMSQSPYFDIWDDLSSARPYNKIRYINTFLERIGDVYNLYSGELEVWTAEAKALKAFLYFELVKRYGPIVLVPQNIGVEADIRDMRIPRSNLDECFAVIIRLLDEAIADLPPRFQKDQNRQELFYKESAMALRAKVLLWQASPLFNGNENYADFKNRDGTPMFSTTYDPEKWRRAAEALDEVIAYCEELGYELVAGNTDRSTGLLNTMRDIELSVKAPMVENSEMVFFVGGSLNRWEYQMPRISSTDSQYNLSVRGGVGTGIKMVEMFYTDNGLPLEWDRTWNYAGRYQLGRENSTFYRDVIMLGEDVLQLHLKREPRFYANVAGDGMYWLFGTGYNSNLPIRAYRGARFGLQEPRIITNISQNISGYWVKKFVFSDYDFQNYLSGQNLMSRIGYPLIRLADLYLMQAEAWNEYEGPSDKVYNAVNKVRERAGIPTVQSSWLNYSRNITYHTTQNGLREIIHRERTIELAYEGHRFWDLRRWKKAHLELNSKPLGWNVLGVTPREFFNNFEGPVVIWNRAEFRSPRDYLFPIKAEEVMISGYVQNPGW